MQRWSRWSPDDGPYTAALHRTLSAILGLMLVGLVVYNVADDLAGNVLPTLWLAVTTTVLALLAARALRGHFDVLELAVFGATCVTHLLVAQPREDLLRFSTSLMVTSFAIATVVTLRGFVAIPAGLAMLVLSVLIAFGTSHQLGVYATDLHLLNAAIVLGGATLVHAVWSNNRTNDLLYVRTMAAQERDLEQELQDAATDAVRRVLHDDVITALRDIVEFAPGQEPDVRKSCQQAIQSIGKFSV